MAVIGSQLTYCVEVAAELLSDVEEQTVRSVHQAQRPGRESPFTATVTSSSTPTGSVEFYDGSTDLGPGTAGATTGTTATWTYMTSTLTAGSHTVQAVYTATGNFSGSTSSNLTQTVSPAPLTITAQNDSKTYSTLKSFSGTAFTETGLVTANGDTLTGVTETSTGAPAS